MFIQTEQTPDPATLKFLPGHEVMASGTAHFSDAESAKRSPLAERLFAIESVIGVSFGSDFVSVTKGNDTEWHLLKPAILGIIMEHFVANRPVFLEEEEEALVWEGDEEEKEIAGKIKELIDTRIRPAAADSGGNVIFKGFKEGIVLLDMQGPATALKSAIENTLRHYLPSVVEVRDYRDAIPKPGLDTPEGQAIRRLLDEKINPGVAAHGGHISLVDVKDNTVYIRLEGGCQGCGMADVTLKQGVVQEIQAVVPAIAEVLDVTDHAGGKNPYYQPGKGGASPL